MKKMKMLVALFIIMGCMITGCSSGPHIELTEEESDAIAQYSAYLLLKYDKNKTAERKLLDIKELEDIYNEENGKQDAETATPTPDIPTPTQIQDDPEPSATPTEAPTAEPSVTSTPENKADSLTELYAKDGFTVEYGYYKLEEQYVENEFSVITPKQEGDKVLSLNFLIKNTGKNNAKFVSKDSAVKYLLYCDNGDILGPQICALPNDIQFLNDDIKAGGSYDAVLLFFVNDNEKAYSLKAVDENTGLEYDIKIK
ncbi:MAG: hypothetical protein K5795_01285 [Lachnospiraceae bacterium]|nr:hypothetical protein [Lachnospiraceae bacterium]